MATKIPAPGTNSTQTSAQTLAPPAYGSGSTQTYIGVPNDYTAWGTGPTQFGAFGIQDPATGRQVAPIYKLGDEYRELPTNTQDLINLQRALIAGGYLSNSEAASIVYGSPDPVTVAAFRKLLVTSNISGQDWNTALSARLAAAGQQAPDSTKQHTPLVLRPDNPLDIANAAKTAGATLNGTYLNPQELAQFTSAYQGQENAYSQASYAATGYDPVSGQQDPGFTPDASAGAGGVAVKPPSLDAAAQDAIRQAHPNELAANEFTSAFDPVLASLANPSVSTAGVK